MINSINAYSCSRHKNPSFGSVVQSRVVLRKLNPQGFFEYFTLKNYEKGIVGVYKSLALKVQTPKAKNIVDKLSRFIPDFNSTDPILRSTKIGISSVFKRFLLTGNEAREIDFYGRKFIGYDKNKDNFIIAINGLVQKGSRRIKTANGKEIGIDLIVEGAYKKRKLVDIEILDADKLNYAKPPQKLPSLRQEVPAKKVRLFQPEFDFSVK